MNTATATKLSALMRDGLRIVKRQGLKQIKGDYFTPGLGVCALGAAMVGWQLVHVEQNEDESVDNIFVQNPGDVHLLNNGQSEALERRLNTDIPWELVPTEYQNYKRQRYGEGYNTPTTANLWSLIPTLNDDLGWSIPRIATWLESIGR